MKYNKSVSDKVVEQLSGLSDWMTSEFDAESDRVYYEHANYITKTVEQLQDYGKGKWHSLNRNHWHKSNRISHQSHTAAVLSWFYGRCRIETMPETLFDNVQ